MEVSKPNPTVPARADRWVAEAYPALTRSQVQEAFQKRWILNRAARPLKKGDRIAPGDWQAPELDARLRQLQTGNAQLKLGILSECEDYWVVDKPAGMPSHPLRLEENGTITHWALTQKPNLIQEFATPLPLLSPHRLDTGTSGVLVVAKTQSAYEHWRQIFIQKQVNKRYLAWCWGEPTQSEFMIQSAIAHDLHDSSRMVTVDTEGYLEDAAEFRPPILPAVSEIKVVAVKPGRFLAEVICQTGVTHQIRVHLASAGYPVVGDSKYDPEFATREWKPEFHLLRAVELTTTDGLKFQADETEFRAL